MWRPFRRRDREPEPSPVDEATVLLLSLARDLQVAADHLNDRHRPNHGPGNPPSGDRV